MPSSFVENMKHLMIWLLVIVLLCQTALSNGVTFESKASDTVALVEKTLGITDCIRRAKEDVNTFYLSGDEYYAVLWISMYSRECFIDENLLANYTGNENRFPLRLNEELRCKHFSRPDPKIQSICFNVSSVINEALTLIKPQQHKQLFRGVKEDWPFVNRYYFVEEGFFNSSSDINEALNFPHQDILLVIKGLSGVYIADYVEERFAYKKEVLGTSGKLFKIENTVIDDREINDLMSGFKVSRKLHPNNPKKILLVREISASQQKKDKVINEQKHLLEGTCWNGPSQIERLVRLVQLVGLLVVLIIKIIACLIFGILAMYVLLLVGTLAIIIWIVSSIIQIIVLLVFGIQYMFGYFEQEGLQKTERTDL